MNPSLPFWQRLKHASSTAAMQQTATYYAAFTALGLTVASLGPTLLGLADQTGSALSDISFLFLARALGYLFGSFTGGRLYDRLPGHRTMAVALAVMAVLLASVPTIPLLWLLTVVLLAVGFMEGIVDVGGNTLIVWVHREKVSPYMNGLHLFFAAGALLSPLLIVQAIQRTGSFAWSYWVLALLLVPIVLLLLPLSSPPSLVTHEEHKNVRPNVLLVVLVAAFFVTISGSEASFSGWVVAYGVKTNLMSEAAAQLLNAGFWGAFLVGRIASIPIATRVRPRVIIAVDLVLALVGILVIWLFANSPEALWVGTILFGLGIASAFPTILTFAGRHMTITGSVTSWFFIGASIGAATLPLLIGQLFERISPMTMVWVIGSTLVGGLVVFGLILWQIRSMAHSQTEKA